MNFQDRSIRYTYLVLDGVRVKLMENVHITQEQIREYSKSYNARYKGQVIPKDGIYMFYCFERRKQ